MNGLEQPLADAEPADGWATLALDEAPGLQHVEVFVATWELGAASAFAATFGHAALEQPHPEVSLRYMDDALGEVAAYLAAVPAGSRSVPGDLALPIDETQLCSTS